MSATEALALAHAAGVRVRTDGDDLVLEASAPPPPAVLDLVSRHKADIITLLRSPAPEPPRTPEPIPPLPSSGGAEHTGLGAGGCRTSRNGRWAARCRASSAAELGRSYCAAFAWMLLHLLQGPAMVARARGAQRLALLGVPSAGPSTPRCGEGGQDMTDARVIEVMQFGGDADAPLPKPAPRRYARECGIPS